MDADGLVLALDQGTSSTKGGLYNLRGEEIAYASRRTVSYHPGLVGAVGNPESWWDALVECTNELVEDETTKSRIVGIGICGFMHTLVPIGNDGSIVAFPILWSDQRGAGSGAVMPSDSHGSRRRLSPSQAACRQHLARLARENPTLRGALRRLLPVKDYLRWRLTGDAATDGYEASGTGLFDPDSKTWDSPALAELGFGTEILPSVLSPLAIGGHVSASAAQETGLRQGTPVIVGSGDWLATLVGTGAALPDRACVYLGTSGALGAFNTLSDLEELANPTCLAAGTSAGSSLDWLAQIVEPGSEQTTGNWQTGVKMCPPGARGLMFFPHLMGERGDGVRPRARGALLGITLAHEQADVARAVLEGTALWLCQIFKEHLATLETALLVASGGGAKSPLWIEIVASMLDREIGLLSTCNGGLLGMAMLTAVGLNIETDIVGVSQGWTSVQTTVKPNVELVNVYGPLARRFAAAEALLSQMETWDQESEGG